MKTPDPAQLRRWLLHELPADEAAKLEERLFDDDDLAAALRDVEHDLRDDYARGALTPAQRRAVERHLLAAPEDRRRQVFAEALARRASPAQVALPRPRPSSAFAGGWRRRLGVGIATAAAIVLVMVFGGLSPWGSGIAPLSMQATASLPTIMLPAGAQRGSDVHSISLPRDATRLRLQAEVVESASGQRYTLRIVDGANTLFSQADLVAHQAGSHVYVEAIVDTAVFGDAMRTVVLDATGAAAPAGEWNLRVRPL